MSQSPSDTGDTPGDMPVPEVAGHLAPDVSEAASRSAEEIGRRILTASRKLFLAHGFAGTSMDAVAAEVTAGTAHPISDDIPALVRTLAVTTTLMLSGDRDYLGPDGDVQRGIRVLEALWLNALWGGSDAYRHLP